MVGHTKDTSAFNEVSDGNTDGGMKFVMKVNIGNESKKKKKTLGIKVRILENLRVVK